MTKLAVFMTMKSRKMTYSSRIAWYTWFMRAVTQKTTQVATYSASAAT